jgi:hypothetical protein
MAESVDDARERAEEVLKGWSVSKAVGIELSDAFLVLHNCAGRYVRALHVADNHRKFNSLTEEDEIAEATTRQAFMEVYMPYVESLKA